MKRMTVLLVEDSPGDVRLTKKPSAMPDRRSICRSPPTAWKPWPF